MRPRGTKNGAPSSAALRAKLGLNQLDWARILSVSIQTVLRWESGASRPRGLALVVLHGIEQAIAKTGPAAVRDRLILGLGHLLYDGLTRSLRS